MTAATNETGTTVNDLRKPVHDDMHDTFGRNQAPAATATQSLANDRNAIDAPVRIAISVAVAFVFTVILAIMAAPASAQTTDSGADIYEQQCARCHQSDGLGIPGTYPPIAGNPDAADHDYVVVVVTDGLSGKEILGVSYSLEMPSFGNRLSAEEIDAVASYTAELSTSGPDPSATTTVPLSDGAAEIGENLFIGGTLLSAGGTACVACHTAGEYDGLGGPTMAISLNGIVETYGKSGFIASITDPVVDPMIAVFGDHPITDQEANDIAAYLETTTTEDSGNSPFDILIVAGIGGFLLLILITARVIRGPQHVYVEKLRSTR